jgi:carboxypeptidase T
MKRPALFILLGLGAVIVALAIAVRPAPAGDNPVFNYEEVVVRAYFDDPQMVWDLASWNEPWEVHYDKGYVVVEVSIAEYALLERAGFRLEIDHELTEELNRPLSYLPGQLTGIPGYPCYRTVEETYATAESLAAAYPHLATWTVIGESWEKQTGFGGYDLKVLRLTNSNVEGEKPKIFIMAALHAREYTTAELVTRMAEYLVYNYGVDPDATWLLDHHEFHLLLQANPDGRKRAETGLSWRKNTNNNYCVTDPSKHGADLNRNFTFYWGGTGSSSNQCSDIYRGPSPASEPETQAIQNYVRAEFPDQRDDPIGAGAPITATGIFLDIHSYSQLVLWPWGFTSTPTANGTAFQTLGRKLAYFNNYQPTQAVNLYPTTGTTDDFAYGELGLAAYTYELGTSFFQQCSAFENTILPDNLPSLLYAAKVARTPYLTPAGPDALNLQVQPAAVASGESLLLTALLDDTRYNHNYGAEPVQNIVAAEYYINTPPWITTTTPVALPMAPADGAFNSPIETAQAVVDTTVLETGRHTLFVRGQDTAGNWGAFTAQFFYIISPPPVAPAAGFTSSSPDALGSATTFTNLSTGTDLSFEWDFGDGSPLSSAQDPVHTYSAVDSYTVTLTVTNGLGSDVATGVVEILAGPEAAFTTSAWTVLGDATVFTNSSTGTALSYTWEFGDDSPLNNEENPVHIYTAAGSYTVTLTVTNSVGSDVATAEVNVLEAPAASFSATTPVALGSATVFTNSSTGTALSYTWEFGDDSPLSDEENPVHTYTAAGSYTVTLTVTNSVGSDLIMQVVEVTDDDPGSASYLLFLPVIFAPEEGPAVMPVRLLRPRR